MALPADDRQTKLALEGLGQTRDRISGCRVPREHEVELPDGRPLDDDRWSEWC
jgi:hypothetical protein